MRSSTTLVVWVLLLAIPFAGRGATPDAIRNILEQQVAAWNRGDLDEFVASYAPHCTLVGRTIPRPRGLKYWRITGRSIHHKAREVSWHSPAWPFSKSTRAWLRLRGTGTFAGRRLMAARSVVCSVLCWNFLIATGRSC